MDEAAVSEVNGITGQERDNESYESNGDGWFFA